jgi:hypothetical protein
MISDICFDVFEIDREIGSCHDDGNNIFYRMLRKGTAEHGDFRILEINGSEKGKSHDVIPMAMGEEHREDTLLFLYQPMAQAPDSRAGVHNDDVVVFRSDFNAGRVSPIFQILPAGNGNGPARAPTPNNHVAPPWNKSREYNDLLF